MPVTRLKYVTLAAASILLSGCTVTPPPQTQTQSQTLGRDSAIGTYVVEAAKPAPTGAPFSRVIEAGGVVYLAGHLGRDPVARDYPAGIAAQTTQTLQNIGDTLQSVGADHSDVVRCQVFMTDISGFSEMNRAYRQFFPVNPPARTTVEIAGLAAPNALIEIECTAVKTD
jgi:reactive intermediate/imine deaminase